MVVAVLEVVVLIVGVMVVLWYWFAVLMVVMVVLVMVVLVILIESPPPYPIRAVLIKCDPSKPGSSGQTLLTYTANILLCVISNLRGLRYDLFYYLFK